MAQNYGPKIPTDSSLTLAFNAADRNSYPGSGTNWYDLSSHSYNSTLNNGPTFTSAYGGGIVLDGSNDYVEGSNDLTNEIGSTGEISIVAVAKVSNMSARAPLLGKYQPYAPYGYAFELGSYPGYWNSMRFYAQGYSGYYSSDYRGSTLLTSNKVYMFSCLFAPGSSVMKMYYNLTQMPATQQNINWTSTAGTYWEYAYTPFYLGSYQPAVGVYGNMTIYNTYVYNRILSFTELTQIYNVQKTHYNL